MFTKISLVLLSGCLVLGCQRLPWGEKVANPKPPPNKIGSEIRCLKHVLPILQAFVAGEAKPAEVSQGWQCFSGALQLFKNKIRGEQPQGYQATELKEFFEGYFLKEGVKISPGLMEEIMRLKQVFFGGSIQVLTRPELEDLILFASEIEGLSLEILPSMKILTKRWSVSAGGIEGIPAAEFEFDLAKLRAEKALIQMASRIEAKGQSYKIANFLRLMEEFEILYAADWSFIDSLKKGLPLFQKLKKSLMGTDETVVLATEWRQFGLLGVQSYLLYLRYHYFVQTAPPTMSSAPDYRLAVKSIDDLMLTCGEFISQKPSSRLEVAEILEIFRQAEQVFPSLKISPDLMSELMKIKILLVGGNQNEFTPQDFQTARTKLNSVRAVAELYKKWAEIYGGNWVLDKKTRAQARLEFNLAEADLLKIAENLGSLFQASYDLKDLVSLFKSYEITFPPKAGAQPVSQVVERYLNLGVSVKDLLLNDWLAGQNQSSGLNSVVGQDSWPPLLANGARIYTKFLFYHYFLKQESWLRGSSLQDSETLSGQVHETLKQVVRVRNSLGIQPWEVAVVFEQVQKAKLTELDLSFGLVTSLVQKIVKRFFTSPELRFASQWESAISLTAIETLFVEVNAFFRTQKAMDLLLDQKPEWTQEELRDSLGSDTVLGKEISKEITNILAGNSSMALTPEGRMYLNPDENKSYDEPSLVRLNTVRALVRWMFRGYADELNRAVNLDFLKATEVAEVFNDFRGVAIELGLIDPANERFAKNRFLEANLFSPQADGNDVLSFHEGTWIFAYILSGLNINRPLAVATQKACGKLSRLETECALQSVVQIAPSEFSSMPQMVRFLNKLDLGEKREMFKDLFTAIGWSADQRKILATDLSMLPHIVQYIEAVMRRGDANKDGIIVLSEALQIEPAFRPLLSKVSGFDDPAWLQALFAYILVYGNAPESPLDEVFFAADWVSRATWPVQADRKKLAKILAVLTAKARTTR